MSLREEKSNAHSIVMFFTLFLGYEWFMSGLGKLLSGKFVMGFHDHIAKHLSKSYGFYTPVMKHLILPYSKAFGYFIEFSELFIGIVFIIAFFVMITNAFTWMLKWTIFASYLATFISLNIFLFSGETYFANPAKPFKPSVSFNILFAVMEICLIVYFTRLHHAANITKSNRNHISASH